LTGCIPLRSRRSLVDHTRRYATDYNTRTLLLPLLTRSKCVTGRSVSIFRCSWFRYVTANRRRLYLHPSASHTVQVPQRHRHLPGNRRSTRRRKRRRTEQDKMVVARVRRSCSVALLLLQRCVACRADSCSALRRARGNFALAAVDKLCTPQNQYFVNYTGARGGRRAARCPPVPRVDATGRRLDQLLLLLLLLLHSQSHR